jgi:hypothetical protein
MNFGVSGLDPSPPSSNRDAAVSVEPALGRLVHRCHHRPPLQRERGNEPRDGSGVEPGRGLIQHQQARVESRSSLNNGNGVEPGRDGCGVETGHTAAMESRMRRGPARCLTNGEVRVQHVILRHEAARP